MRNTAIRIIRLSVFLACIIILILPQPGCTGRSETAVILADSTISYPSHSNKGIEAMISLHRTISKKTGKRIGEGTLFTIRKDASVKAFIQLKNRESNKGLLMFHLDWVDPEGNSVFLKRIDIQPGDTITSIKSSISVEPGKREAGEYTLRIFLFRELIAEKKFRLREDKPVTADDVAKIKSVLTLCKSYDKKTGLAEGIDSVFIIGEKSKIRAVAKVENLGIFFDQTMNFRFDWINQAGETLFTKKINIAPGTKSDTLLNTFTADPAGNKPGSYKVRLSLFDFLLSEKAFTLKFEPGTYVEKIHGLSAQILLGSKIDKKSGALTGSGNEFKIGEKEKVVAKVLIENETGGTQEIKVSVEWTGPNGKTFYDKQESFSPDDTSPEMISSVSISPEKRKPGKYGVKVFIGKKLIAERKFLLK